MPDLLQILCAHCSGNQILVTWRYLFLRESNNAARCAGKCPNPQCLSAPTTPSWACTGSATSPPVLSRDCSRSPETKNRLGLQLFCDCGLSRGAKTRIAALKCSKNGCFRAWRSREESVIAKKLQRYRVFCFCNGLNRRNGADPAKNARNIIASNPKSETKRRPLCGRLRKTKFG